MRGLFCSLYVCMTTPTQKLIVTTALSFVGYPSVGYRSAEYGADPLGFDCSGFVKFILCKSGIPLPPHIRHCNEFFDSYGVLIHQECSLPGDLVFISRDGMRPTHIGIKLNETEYIHAPGFDNTVVSIETIPDFIPPPCTNAIYVRNPIGFKRIALENGRWKKLL
jgi:cell wall-associated NlpC family hydrolase